jgi:hypothetical protein
VAQHTQFGAAGAAGHETGCRAAQLVPVFLMYYVWDAILTDNGFEMLASLLQCSLTVTIKVRARGAPPLCCQSALQGNPQRSSKTNRGTCAGNGHQPTEGRALLFRALALAFSGNRCAGLAGRASIASCASAVSAERVPRQVILTIVSRVKGDSMNSPEEYIGYVLIACHVVTAVRAHACVFVPLKCFDASMGHGLRLRAKRRLGEAAQHARLGKRVCVWPMGSPRGRPSAPALQLSGVQAALRPSARLGIAAPRDFACVHPSETYKAARCWKRPRWAGVPCPGPDRPAGCGVQTCALLSYRDMGWHVLSRLSSDYRKKGAEERKRLWLLHNQHHTVKARPARPARRPMSLGAARLSVYHARACGGLASRGRCSGGGCPSAWWTERPHERGSHPPTQSPTHHHPKQPLMLARMHARAHTNDCHDERRQMVMLRVSC